MFDGIIIGGTSGAGSLNLQQVTDNGNTTTNDIHVNRAFLADVGTGGEVVIKCNNNSVTFAESPGSVTFDFLNSSGPLYACKSNTAGNLLSDANIFGNTYPANAYSIGATTITIPHGLSSAPSAVLCGARDADAMTALKVGYWLSWTATDVIVHLATPTTGAASSAAFTLFIFIQPA